jgi:hypothetical protein
MSVFENVINEANKKNEVKDVTPESVEIADEGEGKKSFAERMAEKKNQCYAMIDDACLNSVSSVDNLRQFLNVQSRFDKYSLNNALLIFAQKPDAVKVKDFDAWKKDDISIKKGAKSFMILEPSPYKGTDGKMHRGYNAKNVFDISDVEAPEDAIPQPKSYEQKQLVAALVHDAPVPVRKAEHSIGENDAIYDAKNKVVYFKAGLEFDTIFPAIAKALAHAEMAKDVENYRIGEHEFAARCSAYVLSQRYGVDTRTVDVYGIPKNIETMEAEDVKKVLGDVHSNVKSINARMNESLEQTQNKEQQTPNKGSKNREER